MREWHPIGQLAERVGAYCWVERRLFTLMGGWAGGETGVAAGSAATVWLATASRRHGALAERWRDRLPVRAGVDRAELMVAPGGALGGVLERLAAEASGVDRVHGLVEVVLPRLLTTYEGHLASGTPVSEGPVLAVLEEARREGSVEVQVGQSLLKGLDCSGDVSREIERMFGGVSGVLPGEWAS